MVDAELNLLERCSIVVIMLILITFAIRTDSVIWLSVDKKSQLDTGSTFTDSI